tara:strand:- start:563 stop:667 length:105 start_codon:yes stop_codon:yes gene_type:complete
MHLNGCLAEKDPLSKSPSAEQQEAPHSLKGEGDD